MYLFVQVHVLYLDLRTYRRLFFHWMFNHGLHEFCLSMYTYVHAYNFVRLHVHTFVSTSTSNYHMHWVQAALQLATVKHVCSSYMLVQHGSLDALELPNMSLWPVLSVEVGVPISFLYLRTCIDDRSDHAPTISRVIRKNWHHHTTQRPFSAIISTHFSLWILLKMKINEVEHNWTKTKRLLP